MARRWSASLVGLAGALAISGCVGSEPRQPKPPKHQDWDHEDQVDAHDYPEKREGPPPEPLPGPPDGAGGPRVPRDLTRSNVKVTLSVYDVIDWNEVKVRGGIRGSIVRGTVSLTGWLTGGKGKGQVRSTTSTFVVVAAGREGSIELSDPAVRELVGPYAALRVAVLEVSERGDVDVAIAPLVSPTADGQMTLATRVRVGPGEGLVVGGHRSEEQADVPGAPARERKRDQLVVLTATPGL